MGQSVSTAFMAEKKHIFYATK